MRTVLGFTAAVAIALALVISMAASLPKEGTFAAWISAGVRRLSGSLRKQRLQRALVVAQIAVSVVLLAGAGLLTRTLIQLSEVSTGLRTEEVLTMPVPLLDAAVATDPAADAAAKDASSAWLTRSGRCRACSKWAWAPTMPLANSGFTLDVKARARHRSSGEPLPRAECRMADPEYFRAAGMRLMKGRQFTITDRQGSGRS